jgi:Ca2+-binding RTX toxin-like protein
MSKGEIAFDAGVALNASTSDEFAQARAVLDHKTDVAVYYSVDLAVAQSGMTALQAVLHGVDSTAASTTAAKMALQPHAPNPYEPDAPNAVTVNLTVASDTYTTPTPDSYNINGLGGNDTITTGSANSTVTTLAGNDTITTGAGSDTINAGDGDNTVQAGGGTNGVTTGTGNDTITTGAGADTIVSGAGNDTITAGAGTDSVVSGAGNDTITAGLQLAGQQNSVTGGDGGDLINFTAGENTRFSFSGSDSTTAAIAAPGYAAGTMDTLGATGLISNAAAWADGTAGARITLATGVSAAAVGYGTAAVVYGATAVARAGDFYVFDTQAGGVAYVYQDTNGNSTIDAGEFGVKLIGSAGAFSAAEFSIAGGNLLYTSGV